MKRLAARSRSVNEGSRLRRSAQRWAGSQTLAQRRAVASSTLLAKVAEHRVEVAADVLEQHLGGA